MRRDPLAYLTTELTSLKTQGLYRKLRVLEDEQKPHTTFDHHLAFIGTILIGEQLSRPHHASATA